MRVSALIRPWFVLVATLATPLRAQVTVLDEGTFSLSVGGTRVGREDFSIRSARGAPGATVVAQANVLEGERRRTIVLNADSLGEPVRYQLEAREGTQVTLSVVAERQRMLWSGRILTPTRESAREFRLAPDTFVLEQGVVHHLWFVLRHGRARPIHLLAPQGPSVVTARLAAAGEEVVEIAGDRLPATRWQLQDAAGDTLWTIWADAAGRILRARHGPSGLEALRDDPPTDGGGR